MTSLVEYISSWWNAPKSNNDGTSAVPKAPPLLFKPVTTSKQKNTDITCLISVNDLLNVKLKPVKNIPYPARNIPAMDKFQLHMLNQDQLKEILNVKLRPTPSQTTRIYEHRHPVLREMLGRVKKI